MYYSFVMISFKETYHYYNRNLKKRKEKRKRKEKTILLLFYFTFCCCVFIYVCSCTFISLLCIGCLFQYCCWILYVYDKYENKYNDKKETERKTLSSILIVCLCFLRCVLIISAAVQNSSLNTRTHQQKKFKTKNYQHHIGDMFRYGTQS